MKRLKQTISELWDKRPLRLILLLALFFRLLAVIFSKGYGWHDDHFLIIEPAHAWSIGKDYTGYLPSSHNGEFKPSGHSFTTSGALFLVFSALEKAGISDAAVQMFVIRLLHALLSLLVVYYGFRITERLFDISSARIAGLLLAVYFFMPFLSVRNLVEIVCIPFLMFSVWKILSSGKTQLFPLLLSGMVMGLAVSIRYQSVLFAAGVGLVLLLRHPFRQTLAWSLGLAAMVLLLQGFVDYMIWGVPFAEFMEYFRYNLASASDYYVREWYMYLVFLAGFLIPPVSIFLISGFIAVSRKALIISIPVIVFLVFHSLFTNKQERFVLTVVPFIIMLGYAGWVRIRAGIGSGFMKGFVKGSWIFFWIVNLIALIPVTLTYSKKSRVESMRFLSEREVKAFIIEDSKHSNFTFMPEFYMEKRVPLYRLMEGRDHKSYLEQFAGWPPDRRPDYILFMYEDSLKERISKVSEVFRLEYLSSISPSFMDLVLHRLNPANRNETIHIYRILW